MATYIEGQQIYKGFVNAAERLQYQRDRLNALNLFPVADKDTGTNMAITMKKTADHISSLGTPSQVVEDAFMNLLEFSHGNSGTILTLFFEGFKEKIPEGNQITVSDYAYAIENGAKTAFQGVLEPIPGTILTVASRSAAAGISMLEATDNVGEILKRISDESHAALMQTAFQNPALKPQKVVDSGALGFCLIMDGFLSGIAPEMEIEEYPKLKLPDSIDCVSGDLPYRFCTEFVIELKDDISLEDVRKAISPQGEYFVMTSGKSICKIHIHTNNPEKVIDDARQLGTIKSHKIDDMLKQL